jgi:hypothetical protein
VTTSRFERQVWVGNWLDKIETVSKKTEVIIRKSQAASVATRSLGYHGDTKRGEMYQIGVSFALQNEGVYSEPLPSVEGNRLYQIRMALAQYQAYPLVMGWALEWHLPTGWVWIDGLGATTYEEFVSNPTVVTRMMRSPVNPAPAGFQILVVGRYP